MTWLPSRMQAVITGAGTLQSLPENFPASNVIVLTYGGALSQPALAALLERWGTRANVHQVPFSTPLLTLGQVVDLAEPLLYRPRPELIVSIGGGAIQDAAKCLKLILDCGLRPIDLLDSARPEWRHDTPHLAVPTTAGTGAEATCFATVYRDATKHSVEDARLLPAHVVLDPTLLASVPRETAIFCGFDALAQALESVWAIRADAASVDDALSAARGILGAFEAAIADRSAPALAEMQRGAYLAGRAIQVSRTTLAHALSYPLSARFGLPHGLAVFLNLAGVIRFNAGLSASDCQEPKGIAHYHEKMARLFAVFEVSDHEGLARCVEGWFDKMGISPRFESYGVSAQDRAGLLAVALISTRSGNNPRRATAAAWTAETDRGSAGIER